MFGNVDTNSFLNRASNLQPIALAWRTKGAEDILWPGRSSKPAKNRSRLYGFTYFQWSSYFILATALFLGGGILVAATLGVSADTRNNANSYASLYSLEDSFDLPPGTLATSQTALKDFNPVIPVGYVNTPAPSGGGGVQGSDAGGSGGEPQPPESLTVERSGDNAFDAGATGDPHFSGFDGTGFDFHGHPGGIFNILTETNHQLNAQLDDMGQGSGYTFLKALGLKYRPTGTKMEVCVLGPGKLGVRIQDSALLPIYGRLKMDFAIDCSLEYISGSAVEIETVHIRTPDFGFSFTVKEGQMHIDMQTALLNRNKHYDMHGVMGQTYNWLLAENQVDPKADILGDGDTYEVSGLFADDFQHNKYDSQPL